MVGQQRYESPSAIRTARQLRPEAVDSLASRFATGESIRAIANETGLHTQTVSRHLRERGINTMAEAHRHWKLTPTEIDELVSRYCSGTSINELAKLLRIHANTIGKYLADRGINTKPPALSDDEARLAVQRYEQGWTIKRIATEIGTSPHSVWRRLRAAGVAMRARGRAHADASNRKVVAP